MKAVKQYILSKDEINDALDITTKKSAKNGFKYQTEFADGIDFVVNRIGESSSLSLVVLMSQKQFYIKNNRTGKIDFISDSTKINKVASFLSYLSSNKRYEIIDKDCNKPTWIDYLRSGKNFAKAFCNYIWNEFECNCAFIKAGMGYFVDIMNSRCDVSFRYPKFFYKDNNISFVIKALEYLAEAYKNIDCDNIDIYIKELLFYLCVSRNVAEREIYQYMPNSETVPQSVNALFYTIVMQEHLDCRTQEVRSGYVFSETYRLYNNSNDRLITTAEVLRDMFGMSGLREFYKIAAEQLTTKNDLRIDLSDLTNSVLYSPVNHKLRNFQMKNLYEYLFYSSRSQGFIDMRNFLDTWGDTLSLQELTHGKIFDKYPENLLSEHQIMTYRYRLNKEEYDENLFQKAVNNMMPYQYKGKDFSIICPKTHFDMIDEAQMQNNCLSSYISRVMAGDCMIFFMRKNDDLAHSYITIEVRNGRLGQVYRRFNQNPSREEMDFVRNWFQAMFDPESAIREQNYSLDRAIG